MKPTPTLDNTNARNIAVNALLTFQMKQLYLQPILHQALTQDTLAPRDKRLAGELTYGTCRMLITLDYLIDKASSRPIKRVEPLILSILRVALYQMLFLETPDFAAVNEAVAQTEQTLGRKTSGYVNAVLRNLQRLVESPINQQNAHLSPDILWTSPTTGLRFQKNVFPHPDRQMPKHLSVTYAHPPWLIKRWLNQYTPEMVMHLCLANNARPPLTLRVNPIKSTTPQLEHQLRQHKITFKADQNLIQLQSSANPENIPGYQHGDFSVQDPTAALVAPLLSPKPNSTVLDLCAAPGGKTTHLAELMNNQGTILACDVAEDKLQLIQDNCQRLGVTIVQTTLASDLQKTPPAPASFDAILLDVPCSNTGVLARRVEVRHLLAPAGLKNLARIQSQLLEKAAPLLKPQGKLLYSTCSIDHSENQLVINQFLKGHPNFQLLSQKLTWPYSQSCQSLQSAKSTQLLQQLQTPHSLSHDGGFTALLQKV